MKFREVLFTALSTLTFPSALLGAAPGSVPSFIVGHALQTGGARYRVYCILYTTPQFSHKHRIILRNRRWDLEDEQNEHKRIVKQN